MSHSYLGFGIIGNLKLIFGNIASHQVEKLYFWDDYLTMVQIVYLFLDIVNEEFVSDSIISRKYFLNNGFQ